MKAFHRLSIQGGGYMTTHKRLFTPIKIDNSLLQKVLDFAYEMCFGSGFHRHHRTGGSIQRKAGEQFCNTFQGKLAEVALRNMLLLKGIRCGEPDFDVYGEGVWDDSDLKVNGKTLSIKSAAHFSNLLLLESNDYNGDGDYLPNLYVGATSRYDYYVLVRISPDIKGLFRQRRWMYSDSIPQQDVKDLILSQNWSYDVPGWISHDEFVSVISNHQIIPKNALLNGRIPMDAENYYIQAGDMHTINELVEILT